ncbi:siderophore ABC transporter substrate-binding protein [Halalkalibacter krulwichiae]|uniref:Putative ABC transporter solute-binding protein YclQ n=1 Tax=Halalkalibacter krulwichiae TaxID=199441 RepID=A0A1X9MFN1_9BACI|nr:siderophore ABC transporter substrate-binding protein [Halalkalibacter krulwichiae]ARK32258.1 putative ABC transporter solute-binding protein YclQ precursor [Halalkalibacter krulwichiae]
MKKNSLFVLMISLLLLFLAACGTSEDTTASPEADAAEEVEEETSITVTHHLGETVVEKNPETVIVFDYGTLETLDQLNVKVAGVAKGSPLPHYLSEYEGDEYENVGSLKEPDFEKIYGMDPDLILISGRQTDAYDELSEIAPTIFVGVDTTNYMESFTENVTLLGEIFGKEEIVEEKLAAINESIDTLYDTASADDKTGLIILTNEGSFSAYGEASRFGIIHDVFGVKAADENIELSTHGMNVSIEYIAEQDPDYLFVIDRNQAIGEKTEADVFNNEVIQGTKAAQNDNIVYLDPTVWYLSGGGLISVEEMVKEITEGIQ